MLKRSLMKLVRRAPPATPCEPLTPIDRRASERTFVFREAVLTLEGVYNIRAIVTDISFGGARVEFATRIDLPGRIVIAEPRSGTKRWARVAWQRDGAAGLAFQEEA